MMGWLWALLIGCTPTTTAPPAVVVEQPVPFERATSPWATADEGGVRLELLLDRQRGASGPLVASEVAWVRFMARYVDGAPASGLRPAAWLHRRPAAGPTPPERCTGLIEQHLGASMLNRAVVDLNGYLVLTLGDGPTISVVDPQFGFGGSRLLARVELPAPGLDWVEVDGTLTVSLTSGAVVSIDTATWELRAHRPVPGAGRLLLDPAGRVWVATATGVSLPGRDVATGEGPHELAVAPERGRLFVTNGGDGSVSIVDLSSLEVITTTPTAEGPASVAWSTAAGAAYVSHRSGRVVVLEPDGAVRTHIDVPGGGAALRFGPDGRRAVLLHPETSLVSVIDAATDRVVQTAHLPGRYDQVVFTERLAYLRGRDDAEVRMLPLDALGGAGQPLQVADFTGGTSAPGPAGLADMMAPALERGAMLVTNPGDGQVYYYQEGMAAPMGSFEVPDEAPRGVRTLDRSLVEREPGEYSALVHLPQAGRYDLAVMLEQPALTRCFALDVEGSGGALRPEIAWQAAPEVARAGEPVTLRFRLTRGGAPLQGLEGLYAFVLQAPGRNRLAAALQADGDAVTATFTPPSPGTWRLHVAADGLDASVLMPATVQVVDARGAP